MKRYIISLFLCSLFFSVSSIHAQEPILVIDPHGHSSQITNIMFTPNGKVLLSVSLDKTVRVWDVESGDLIKTLRHQIGQGREGEIHSAALSPDGKTLAIGGISDWDDEQGLLVYLYDLESGTISRVLGNHTDVVMGLDFSSDNKWLASTNGYSVSIWDLEKESDEPALILETKSTTHSLAFSSDAKKLVSGHEDGTVRIWEIAQALEQSRDSGSQTLTVPKMELTGHGTVACCVDWSPDYDYIVSGDYDGIYFLWDADTGKVKKRFKPKDTANAALFSADGKQVIINNGNRAEVYSVPKLKKMLTFNKHVSPVPMTAFSNNVTAIALHSNDLVATAGGNDYDIYIWNLKTGAVKTRISGKGKRVEAVAFGDNLRIGFGNTSGGINKPGRIERSFDLAEMTLRHSIAPQDGFVDAQMEFKGKTLEYTPDRNNPDEYYRLHVKGGGLIENSRNQGWIRSYTFTPNGDVVVGSSHVLQLHQSDGTPIREFIGHNGEIWAVSVSRDGRLLASASDDQTIKLWNSNTGELLATLFIARDREWVCWVPKGYYAASAGGEKHIGWQINEGAEHAAKYYPVSVFRKQFHKPEIVKRTIARGSFKQALADFKSNPQPVVSKMLPPMVSWSSPEAETSAVSHSKVRVQAKIQSESKLQEIKILVNGRTQAATRGIKSGSGGTKKILSLTDKIDQEVTLTPGKNRISLFAANANAGTTSGERIVYYKAPESKPNLYMVAIGISNYLRKSLNLQFADDDARAISRLFHGQEGRLYNRVLLRELYDHDASQAGIREAVKWLRQETTQQDVVVLFVAAHGTNIQGKYYLLAADTDPDKMEQTGVSWTDFSRTLGNLPSRALLFLDTCHSGQLGQDVYSQRKQQDNTEALRTLSSEEYGVVILAASTGREFSLEHPDWGHGAFTKALLEGLEQGKADYSGDGTVHLRELDLYVAERVESLTSGQQHPTTQKPSSISRFPIVQGMGKSD